MKVDELRTALSGYDASVLKEIVVTLYKMIPKSRKEGGLDELLLNFTKEKAKPIKKEATVDFATLELDVETFLENANEGLYYAPNRVVNKEKRSKWRFEVKRFIKGLIAVQGEDSEPAALLLADLYDMMSYACNYWILSSDNPFSAVGYEQTEFLRLVLLKLFYSGFSEESIKWAVFLTLDSNVDRDTFHLSLLRVMVSVLTTPDTKEIALAQCVAFSNGYYEYQAGKEAFRYPSYNDDFRASEHRNYAVELYLLLKLSLHEYDDGIAYFWKNFKKHNNEIVLYCLLNYFLSDDDFSALWLREYEKAQAMGVKPRDSLRAEYEKRKGAIE